MLTLTKTNVIGNIHLYTLFLPLILKGTVKKVICITTGMADLDLINNYDVVIGSLYASSKAAMNIVTAKFNAQYKKDGVLFMGICPGMVDVGAYNPADCMNYETPFPLSLLPPFPIYTKSSPLWPALFLIQMLLGLTDTHAFTVTPQQIEGLQEMLGAFMKYAPDFKGPAQPKDAIRDVMNVWENASLEKGSGGIYISHLGTKKWL